MSEFGSPVPITLDGTEYRFSPLNFGDIEELDNWVRHEYMRRVMSAMSVETSEEDRRLAMTLAHAKLVDLTWLSGTGAKLIASLRGMIKIAQLSLIKYDSSLTDQKLQQIILRDPEAFKKLSAALKESAGSSKSFQTRATEVDQSKA